LAKLRAAGCWRALVPLDDGVRDYAQKYLPRQAKKTSKKGHAA